MDTSGSTQQVTEGAPSPMEVDTVDFYAPTSAPTPTCEDDKHWYHEKYCKAPPCGKSVPPKETARPSSGFLTCRKVAKKMKKSNLKESKKNKLIAIAGSACPRTCRSSADSRRLSRCL